jgi:succinyl-diaminopimelate desuccinylase
MVEMLKIRAVNPDGGGKGEYARALFVKKWLEDLGFKVTRHDVPDKRVAEGVRVNLTTTLEGQDKSRTLWLAAHLDTVPEGARELWATDPYDPVIKDGKIFGRGSEDNGQAVVSTLFVLKTLKTLKIKPRFNVGAAYVSDEESGSKFGILPLLEKPDIFKPTDMAIVPDSGTPDGSMIEIAEKSILWLKIMTRGKQVHGSTPEKGLNAHRVGMSFALRLDELLHAKYTAKDALFDPPMSTFEPTKHESNVDNVNTVPGVDVQYFDCRVLPQYLLADVMKDVESVKLRVEMETGAKIEINPIQEEQNIAPTPDNEVVRGLKVALEKLRGLDGKPIGIGGGTVALYFRRKGMKTAVWSTLDDLAHQPNEYCKIANMVDDAKVFVHAILV